MSETTVCKVIMVNTEEITEHQDIKPHLFLSSLPYIFERLFHFQKDVVRPFELKGIAYVRLNCAYHKPFNSTWYPITMMIDGKYRNLQFRIVRHVFEEQHARRNSYFELKPWERV